MHWYGIHGVEILYTLMGTGCEWVQRTYAEGQEVIVGQWKDGRVGTFRGIRTGNHGYGATVFGSKGVPPVKPDETLEMFVFMDAAQLSRARGGARVKQSEVK